HSLQALGKVFHPEKENPKAAENRDEYHYFHMQQSRFLAVFPSPGKGGRGDLRLKTPSKNII
ncbi:MAG: hypothetical protein IJS21_05810, partial [Deltaproteobacteria bacterium]|nr:hypothetical protein [Deltaproteobacteria bacterium]